MEEVEEQYEKPTCELVGTFTEDTEGWGVYGAGDNLSSPYRWDWKPF
ncbi:hypothetical protein [Micromonospora cathayae]|uniref:Lasso RiPP family leader peptide-containing protein n=1 Tax=Micromonospora cathayae TaxID=3028804 RepID=A0ABY7ZR97_9ACTN|nr:hypothetical protein [Micromonospora sp. HUAS 3]WDZ84593.1 hypothetical protein PVK37_29880 [Micromonospora sp. HUAS 3]